MIELPILGLLKESPLHGYELKKRLGETLGFLWGVSYGSLYPALRRLESKGLVSGSWAASDNNRRARFYQLTAKGQKLLLASLEQWTTFARSVERVALGDGSNG